MARKQESADLAARVEALEAEVRGLREALTPHARLGLTLARARVKARKLPAREVDRVVDRAVREVRRDTASRASR
jgi:cell division protein FtsB